MMRYIWKIPSLLQFITMHGVCGLVLAALVAWLSGWLAKTETNSGQVITQTIKGAHNSHYYHIVFNQIGFTRYISGIDTNTSPWIITQHFPDLESAWSIVAELNLHALHEDSEAFADRKGYLEYWQQVLCSRKPGWNKVESEIPFRIRNRLSFDENKQVFWTLRIEDRCGWPFRLFCTVTRLAPLAKAPPHYDQEVKWGIPKMSPKEVWNLRPPPGGFLIERWNEWKVIPLRPIWTGLLLNALFWGTILAGIRYGFRFGRRVLRRRRGLCPECAYIIHGTENKYCPECGTTL